MCLVTPVWETNSQRAEASGKETHFALGIIWDGKKSNISSFLINLWQTGSTALQDYYDYRLQHALQVKTFGYLLSAWLIHGW